MKKIVSFLIVLIMLISLIPSKVFATDTIITFADLNLQKAICQWLGKPNGSTIYQSDLNTKVTTSKFLWLANLGITDLSGMEYFAGAGLSDINLDGNSITNIAPLASITSLKGVSFNDSKVSDLSPLRGSARKTRILYVKTYITKIPIYSKSSLDISVF